MRDQYLSEFFILLISTIFPFISPVKHPLSINFFFWIYSFLYRPWLLTLFFCTSFSNSYCIAACKSVWWLSLYDLDFAGLVSFSVNTSWFIFSFDCWSHRPPPFFFFFFFFFFALFSQLYPFSWLYSTVWLLFFLNSTWLPELLSSASLDLLAMAPVNILT